MQTRTPAKNATPAPNCLGCDGCKGMCRDIFDLFSLPEVILRRSAAVP
ncbi:hypothetical protein [Roseobacter sp. S98]